MHNPLRVSRCARLAAWYLEPAAPPPPPLPFLCSREDVKEARAGDIIAIAGLKDVVTGDTLCDEKAPVLLERMEFPDPVIKVGGGAAATVSLSLYRRAGVAACSWAELPAAGWRGGWRGNAGLLTTSFWRARCQRRCTHRAALWSSAGCH